jgi:hypothetical protein
MPGVSACIDEGAHEWFTAVSRDVSPLHVNPAHARRGPVGQRVVHGAHIVLTVLEALGRNGRTDWTAVSASFRNPLTIGQSFSIEWTPPNGGLVTACATSEDLVLAEMAFRVGVARWPLSEAVDTIDSTVAAMAVPADATGARGVEPLAIDVGVLGARAKHVDPGVAAALCASSRLAGMRCPGSLALLRAFDLRSDGVDAALAWETVRVREALRLVILELSGGIAGTVEVAMRHAPVEQPSIVDLRSVVKADEFTHVRAVVLGASRGLGLLAARVLAVGGANVVLSGRDGGSCEGLPGATFEGLDVAHPNADVVARLRDFRPTHLLHFATPPIPRRLGRAWSDELYGGYAAVYEGGLELAASLASVSPLHVLYPSTMFVEERPSGFDEYIAAKEASERLAADMSSGPAPVVVTVERLPVLATDQTAGAASLAPESNVDVLVPVIRAFAGAET